MQWKAVLAASSAVSTAVACSTSSFDSPYEAYPDCAVACLACPDADYVRNFANNCDYISGDCCKTQYHNIIAATWACVRSPQSGCGPAVAQQAFSVFVKYCANHSVPLATTDVPPGYNATTGRQHPVNCPRISCTMPFQG